MAELESSAEKLAENATKLPEFRNVNLLGVKDKVADILELIGKVDGIFSTYTKHDITHINSMLRMLDWLVPPDTRKVMTSVDWLMVVLSIYFHDLGMVVTSDEFNGRMQNEDFVVFLDRLNKDPEAKDYLARAQAMGDAERDRFFYQEYVRDRHATRIREWIIGQPSRFWPKQFQAVSSEVAQLMSNLPTRFRENLALVCESHHRNDLEKIHIYPLAQRYGNHPTEIANVQYSAFLLRTVDLIHVTKDRTPSMMYKSIRFSDLKSVDEWDKQRGIWSVNMRGRTFDPNDRESHVIEISADFAEERPFFALTEYIAWANQEIRETKRWADASQQLPDAKGFAFPWREIKGDIRVEGNLPRQMRFELDRGRLLDLLVGHTIYNEPTVAVRELLQNAIDAVRFQYHLEQRNQDRINHDKSHMGRVSIDWNPDTRTLTVEDNGIGMDLDIIENHLLRVGSSFYDTPKFQSENSDFTPISRFGIGILTCFMISDNIEIVTCRAGVGRRIRMTSVHADYLLKDLPYGDPQLEALDPHGTRITLILRPSVSLEEKSMVNIVRQWIIVPACEVIYSERGDDRQRIGFEDVAEALRFKIAENQLETNVSYEVIKLTFTEPSGASYELAFAVRKGYFPERTFVSFHNNRTSAVCIEGIRADWHLPGFGQELCALLSVRGNKRFRTTVSRQNLEVDEEYNHVAKLCATSLFGHVQEEVERISAFSGRPLSQASTAGRWVYSSLIQRAEREVNRTLNELFAALPFVVLEYSSSAVGPVGGRTLQSLNVVSSLPELWTIESRTVDYLGVISRDLGKELNIASFLGSLAPEQYDPKVNPVLMDPEALDDHLFASHRVAEVDFSRKHQRTVLRWEKLHRESDELTAAIRKVSREQFLRVARDRGLSTFIEFLPYLINVWERVSRFVIAPLHGDVAGIVAVRTRLVTVLDEGSLNAKIWGTIENTLRTSHSSLSSDELITLILGLLILSSGSEIDRPGRRGYDRYSVEDLNRYWRSSVPDINEILEKLDSDPALPLQLPPTFLSSDNWFDASYFWRDWDDPE